MNAIILVRKTARVATFDGSHWRLEDGALTPPSHRVIALPRQLRCINVRHWKKNWSTIAPNIRWGRQEPIDQFDGTYARVLIDHYGVGHIMYRENDFGYLNLTSDQLIQICKW